MAVVGTIGLFFSIVFHELSHSLVARHFDMPISGITLFIFGGVAELHREPTSAREEFLMAVAGPIASMLLGTAFLAIVALGGGALPAPMQAVFWYLGYINWMLAIFNLAPAFPLDGGRMLRAALWGWHHKMRSVQRNSRASGCQRINLPAGSAGSRQGAAALVGLIPSPPERDSRRGFPTRGEYDSPWQTGGGLPWLLRLGFEGITTPRDCASWRSGLRMPIRRGACWRWRRSTMAGLEPRRRRSAALGCKRCVTGCWHSTLRGRRAW